MAENLQQGESRARAARGVGYLRPLRRWWVPLLLGVLVAFAVRVLLLEPFAITSASMEPTLHEGDRVLISKVVYDLREIRRNDVVVFHSPFERSSSRRGPIAAALHWLSERFGFVQEGEQNFVKRVIGLPGDTVECRAGDVFVNGARLPHTYLSPRTTTDDCGPFPVPPGHLFVMGDNRDRSSDSRSGLGYIPMSNVIGEAVLVIWPPSHAGGVA